MRFLTQYTKLHYSVVYASLVYDMLRTLGYCHTIAMGRHSILGIRGSNIIAFKGKANCKTSKMLVFNEKVFGSHGNAPHEIKVLNKMLENLSIKLCSDRYQLEHNLWFANEVR